LKNEHETESCGFVIAHAGPMPPHTPQPCNDGSILLGGRWHPLPAGAVDFMATSSLVSVDQYLTTSYRPDCDYVDGVLLERNVGRFDHETFAGGWEQIGCAH
jgi:hypothetical protein